MAETTAIEWADGTANFWMGCTKLSAACDGCYAERDWDLRKHRVTWGAHGERVPVKAGAQVIRKHQRHAAAFIAEHGRRPRIFVNSLSDFADNHRSIRPEWREAVWQAARECPDVILLILTKRPQNLHRLLPADWGAGYPNVWFGTTVENQAEADRRIIHLLLVPAARRFLSCEPLLGPVSLSCINPLGWGAFSCLRPLVRRYQNPPCRLPAIDWVIAGGESGRDARPMHPSWLIALRDQCLATGTPFLFKQWGEYLPIEVMDPHRTGFEFHRVGKKVAGRRLHGQEWNEVPGDA